MLEHGGKLRAAARRYGIPLSDWLDLSTGVSPFSYPCPEVPARYWHRLPEEDDGLVEAARSYYGAEHLLPVAGSQAAIQTLPLLRGRSKAGFLRTTYNEHRHAWQRSGHEVCIITKESLFEQGASLDVIVIPNPNNPTGCRFEPGMLLDLSNRLSKRGGWLIVDEAFIDPNEGGSLAKETGRSESLIVLRSLGKFFGLAGTRVGFVLGWPELLNVLREHLGPWTIAGPARYVARKALEDQDWIALNRRLLQQASLRLRQTLIDHSLEPAGGSDFFQWVKSESAREIQHRLARIGILTRLFEDPLSLRFGLPDTEAEWQRLENALKDLR